MPSDERVTAFVRKPPAVVLAYLRTGRAGVIRMRELMGVNKKQWTNLRESVKPLIVKYLDVEKPMMEQRERDLARLKRKVNRLSIIHANPDGYLNLHFRR